MAIIWQITLTFSRGWKMGGLVAKAKGRLWGNPSTLGVNLLVRNEWKGVEIADLVRAQLAHFADLIGPRIAVQGPKLRLNPASAQAIGLALHELATNAG